MEAAEYEHLFGILETRIEPWMRLRGGGGGVGGDVSAERRRGHRGRVGRGRAGRDIGTEGQGREILTVVQTNRSRKHAGIVLDLVNTRLTSLSEERGRMLTHRPQVRPR
jgi:hypothetical protein